MCRINQPCDDEAWARIELRMLQGGAFDVIESHFKLRVLRQPFAATR